MRKRIIFFILAVVFGVSSCQFKLDKAEDNKSDDALVIERFDRLQSRYFTTGDYAALQQMSTQYPTETRTLIENFLQLGEVNDPDINNQLLSFYQDTTLQKVLSEVQLQYADMSDINQSMTNAFHKLRRLMPNVPVPRVYTQIGALSQSIVVSDSVIGISLDKYLGSDYPPYAQFFDEHERESMTRADIVPDCVLFYLLSLFPLNNFESRTQDERDEHLGKVMWATNQIVGKSHFKTPHVKKVADYVRQHPHTSVLKILATRNR